MACDITEWLKVQGLEQYTARFRHEDIDTRSYTAAAHSFAELSQALDAYYQQAGYESDDWAQGKALAPQFLAAYQAFDHASQALTALLDGERDRVQRQLLAAAEARSGRTLEWYTRKLSLDAGPFATCVADHSAAASECAPQFEALTTAYQGFRAYHDGHKTEAYEVFWMSSFDARAKAYFDAANAFMAAARSPKASTKLAPAVGTAYDALLESSDKLRFEFP